MLSPDSSPLPRLALRLVAVDPSRSNKDILAAVVAALGESGRRPDFHAVLDWIADGGCTSQVGAAFRAAERVLAHMDPHAFEQKFAPGRQAWCMPTAPTFARLFRIASPAPGSRLYRPGKLRRRVAAELLARSTHYMYQRGIQPTVSSMRELLAANARAGLLGMSLRTLADLQRSGAAPREPEYLLAFRAAGADSDLASLQGLLDLWPTILTRVEQVGTGVDDRLFVQGKLNAYPPPPPAQPSEELVLEALRVCGLAGDVRRATDIFEQSELSTAVGNAYLQVCVASGETTPVARTVVLMRDAKLFDNATADIIKVL